MGNGYSIVTPDENVPEVEEAYKTLFSFLTPCDFVWINFT